MIDKIFYYLEAYITLAFEFLATHLMTIEGIVGIIFGVFFLGLLSQMRS